MHHRRRRPTRPALRARSPFLVLRPARGHRQATTPSRVHRAAAKRNASRAPCAREAKIAAKPPFKHTAPPAIRRRSAAAGPGRHGRNG
ncbi:hypothetical protein FE789_08830 [Burkholderia pseudomallei]|nr:hypothetical protein FE789_08830 [Burkholderia pseudomallei]